MGSKVSQFTDTDVQVPKQQQPQLQPSEQMKQTRIQSKIVLISKEAQAAEKLAQQGQQQKAKMLYEGCTAALIKIANETQDDAAFNKAIRHQITQLALKASACSEQQKAPQEQSAVLVAPVASTVATNSNVITAQEKKDILSKLDPKMVQNICESIIDKGQGVKWDDIQGLKPVKQALIENIVYPLLRPEIFQGVREPTKGILLYGPPGNGKTLLAKAVATQCESTFFSISASTIMSKWVGESEKLMRTLFALAQVYSPSIIFIDEVDSMLTKRSSEENESARRVKTEFLIQLDGVGSGKGRVLVIGATNRPFDLDEAALRRMTRRIFIGLPDAEAREGQIRKMLQTVASKISDSDMAKIIVLSKGYSSADLAAIVKDAAMNPIRDLPTGKTVLTVKAEELRPIQLKDFVKAFQSSQPSVSKHTLNEFEKWHRDTKHIQ